MTDREKVLQALEHCDLCSDMPNCPGCAYLREPNCMEHLKRGIIALLKAQEPVEARLNLCESCTKEYAECEADKTDLVYGSGVGNDNIIGCTAYVNRWKARSRQYPICERCGKQIDHINTSVFQYDGTDSEYQMPLTFDERTGCVVFETTQNWTGYELTDEERKDIIRCPHCGEYPFDSSVEIEFHEPVEVLMWTAKNVDTQRDYEAAVEMAEYCERYEPTYNADDGSM